MTALALAILVSTVPGAAPVHLELVEGSVRFEARCLGILPISGRFVRVDGDADSGREDGVELRLHVAVGSLTMGSPAWTARLLSPSFFDAARFPDIEFTARASADDGSGATLAAGTLRLHGVERPVTVRASVAETLPGRLVVQAHLALNRSDYGLGEFTPLVSDRVELWIELEARADAPGGVVAGAPAQRPTPAAAKASHTFTTPPARMPAASQ